MIRYVSSVNESSLLTLSETVHTLHSKKRVCHTVPQKVTYERGLFMRGSNLRVLSGKILMFWIG